MHYIVEDLEIPVSQVYNSNVVAVASTISLLDIFVLRIEHLSNMAVPRLVVGPLCERFGPRRIMAGLLFIGSIPCAMTGLLQNAEGLIGLR